jgi:hypothetical protein
VKTKFSNWGTLFLTDWQACVNKARIISELLSKTIWRCNYPCVYRFSFSCGTTAQLGPGRLVVEGSRSHTIRHTHARTHAHTHTYPLGLLWTSDQLVAETSTWKRTTITTENIHAPPPEGFEPVIPATERLQNYARRRGHWDRRVHRITEIKLRIFSDTTLDRTEYVLLFMYFYILNRMDSVKLIDRSQNRTICKHKNIKCKVLKCNENIYFSKQCLGSLCQTEYVVLFM